MAVTIYANALLSDGKILFWYTGRNKCNEYDFYKDFYYSEINQTEYFKNHKIECKSIGFLDETEDDDYNNFCFNVLAKNFYRIWEISSDSKGSKPYDNEVEL